MLEWPVSRVSSVDGSCYILEVWSGGAAGPEAPGFLRDSVWRLVSDHDCVSWHEAKPADVTPPAEPPPRGRRSRRAPPPVCMHRAPLRNHARLDWQGRRWAGRILKGGNIRTGAARRREASAKAACKFLTCLAYVNEPFFPLWYNYDEGILPLVGISVSRHVPDRGWGGGLWRRNGCINSNLQCLEVKWAMLANMLRMMYDGGSMMYLLLSDPSLSCLAGEEVFLLSRLSGS